MHDRDVNAAMNIKEEGVQMFQDQGITIIRNMNAIVGTTGSHTFGDRLCAVSTGGGQGRRKPSAFRQC